jgi:hypothetical protein
LEDQRPALCAGFDWQGQGARAPRGWEASDT